MVMLEPRSELSIARVPWVETIFGEAAAKIRYPSLVKTGTMLPVGDFEGLKPPKRALSAI